MWPDSEPLYTHFHHLLSWHTNISLPKVWVRTLKHAELLKANSKREIYFSHFPPHSYLLVLQMSNFLSNLYGEFRSQTLDVSILTRPSWLFFGKLLVTFFTAASSVGRIEGEDSAWPHALHPLVHCGFIQRKIENHFVFCGPRLITHSTQSIVWSAGRQRATFTESNSMAGPGSVSPRSHAGKKARPAAAAPGRVTEQAAGIPSLPLNTCTFWYGYESLYAMCTRFFCDKAT
jgi:hypothetical protein